MNRIQPAAGWPDLDESDRDESGVKIGHALVGGLLGGIAASAVQIGARVAGVPIDVDRWIGSWLTADADAALTVGVALQIALFTVIALVYACGFEWVVRRSGWTVGLAFSLVHAAVAVGVVATLAPGPLGANAAGSFPAVFTLVATGVFVSLHLLYGIIVGWLYGERRSGPRPVTQPAGSPKVGRAAAAPDADADAAPPRLSRRC